MLRGERGFQAKEIAKLLEWLRSEPRFDVINLPYALLLGLAAPLRRELKAPICCTLQGEDLFLDGLGHEYRSESMSLIRAAMAHVDAFLPVSEYYRDFMTGYLGIPREKMRLVPLGINMDGYGVRPAQRKPPFTIGYLARIAPEKGLHALAEAYHVLRDRTKGEPARLVAAGYLPPEHQPYLEEIRRKMREWGLEAEFEYRGEVDRAQKTAFLQSLDVFSVPTTYAEPKGMFLLEAMANAVPVVQPRRGAFPEMVSKTGGGVIVEPDNPSALADACLELWRNPDRATALGRAGAAGVREHYDVGRMAEAAESAYESIRAHTDRRHVDRRPRFEELSHAAWGSAHPQRRVAVAGARRRRGHHGAVGQRQEHPALHPRRARSAVLGHRDARRPRSVQARRA